jgi:hypothetical protein
MFVTPSHHPSTAACLSTGVSPSTAVCPSTAVPVGGRAFRYALLLALHRQRHLPLSHVARLGAREETGCEGIGCGGVGKGIRHGVGRGGIGRDGTAA